MTLPCVPPQLSNIEGISKPPSSHILERTTSCKNLTGSAVRPSQCTASSGQTTKPDADHGACRARCAEHPRHLQWWSCVLVQLAGPLALPPPRLQGRHEVTVFLHLFHRSP